MLLVFVRYVISLARKSQFLALVAVALIGGGVAGVMFKTSNNSRIEELKEANTKQEYRIQQLEEKDRLKDIALQRKDSMIFIIQEKANNEVKAFLTKLSQDQAATIKEQQQVKQVRSNIIRKSQDIIEKNKEINNKLDNVN